MLPQIQELPHPQTSALFNQFSSATAVDEDASSGPTRSPPRMQGIAIAGTSSASLHFRISPAGGGEIRE